MKIAILGGDIGIRRLYEVEFTENGDKVVLITPAKNWVQSLAAKKPEVVIFPVGDAKLEYQRLELLDEVKSSFPGLPVIFTTNFPQTGLEALARGADSMCQASSDLTELQGLIEKVRKGSPRPAPFLRPRSES